MTSVTSIGVIVVPGHAAQMGVRVALGAGRSHVVGLVLREAAFRLLLGTVAVLASLAPAWGAAHVEPLTALHTQ